jgi:GDP-4-dehydro-6-deoxy-D-mannose reductase
MERRALASEWGPEVAVIVARAFNHSGPGQGADYAVPSQAKQLAAIEAGQAAPEIRVGNLESVRDFSDVRDVVAAYRLLMRHGTHAECFNVCSGRGVRVGDLLEMLIELAALRVTVIADPDRMRPADIQVNLGSPRKLEARTGWRPNISLSRMLADTLNWWRQHLARQ